MHYVFTAFVWNAAAVIFCKPVIYWQYFRQSRENNLKKTHRPLPRLLYHTPHTWKTHHVLHPEKHQMLGSVTSVRTGWANCLPERHSTKWAVLIRRGLFFLLTQRQHRQAVNRAFDPWDLLCSCHFSDQSLFYGTFSMQQYINPGLLASYTQSNSWLHKEFSFWDKQLFLEQVLII